jgi:hypothetical protein
MFERILAAAEGGEWPERYGERARAHLRHGEAAPELLALAEREGAGAVASAA